MLMKTTIIASAMVAATLAAVTAQTPPAPDIGLLQKPLSPTEWGQVKLDYAQTLSELKPLKERMKEDIQRAQELEAHARDLQQNYPKLVTPEKFRGLVSAQGPG